MGKVRHQVDTKKKSIPDSKGLSKKTFLGVPLIPFYEQNMEESYPERQRDREREEKTTKKEILKKKM